VANVDFPKLLGRGRTSYCGPDHVVARDS